MGEARKEIRKAVMDAGFQNIYEVNDLNMAVATPDDWQQLVMWYYCLRPVPVGICLRVTSSEGFILQVGSNHAVQGKEGKD